jgi:hypothetical protein
MIRTIALVIVLNLGIVPCFVLKAQTLGQKNAANIRWLGALPPDELYSARFLDITDDEGILVTRNSVLASKDGGLNWSSAAYARGPEALHGFIGAWLSTPYRIYLLSDAMSLQKSSIGLPLTLIPAHVGARSYMDIYGDAPSGMIFVVGGESVPVTKGQFADLPPYAQGNDANSPSMMTPLISVSHDDGRTWHSTRIEHGIGSLNGIRMFGSNGIAWGPYEIVISADKGRSWRRTKTDIPADEEDAYPVSASIVGNTVYVSTKNGHLLKGSVVSGSLSTVSHIPSPLTDLLFVSDRIGFGVLPSDQPKEKREESQLMRTDDGGNTWVPILKTRRIVAISANHHGLCGASYDQLFCMDLPE